MDNRDFKDWGLMNENAPLALLAVGGIILAGFGLLTGGLRTGGYLFGLGATVFGFVLIVYANLPLYREGLFCTFFMRIVPEERRPFYRWGRRCIILGVLMLACLFLSRP